MKQVQNIYQVPLENVEVVDFCKKTNSFFFYMVDGEVMTLSPVLRGSTVGI